MMRGRLNPLRMAPRSAVSATTIGKYTVRQMVVRCCFVATVASVFLVPHASAATTVLRRISTAADGGDANDGSQSPVLSGDGRYAAFESWASNLHPDDTDS